MQEILEVYENVIREEYSAARQPWSDRVLDAEVIYGLTRQIMEVATAAITPRSYSEAYHISETKATPESVSAHTNLMATLVDRAIGFIYYHNAHQPPFSYREIMEAVRRHDLPENEFGDIPDDGTRDDAGLSILENAYWEDYSRHYPPGLDNIEPNVQILLNEMMYHSSGIGRLLYLADKVSAIIAVLAYDDIGMPPMRQNNDEQLSELDRAAIIGCGRQDDEIFRASEIWTYVYFVSRRQVDYDDSGFLTAVLIMATLMVRREWYDWRRAMLADFLG